MATTTLTGTTGNDILNAPGSVSTLVQGLQGNDTITLSLSTDEGAAGAGNDVIRIANRAVLVNTIQGGDGNDTVLFNSAAQFGGYIDLGAGSDSIAFSATAPLINGGQIYGGEGSDTIRLANSFVNATIGAGSGNDLVAITAAGATVTSSLINGGKEKDTISFGPGGGSFATVAGGQGADQIAFTAGNFTNTLVGGGQGVDSIQLGAGEVATVAGGGLSDTITFTSGAYSAGLIFGDANGVTTEGTGTEGAADGADFINGTQTDFNTVSVYGAGGNDTIAFRTRSAGMVDGGNGADSIFVGLATAGSNYGLGTISGGAGLDTINVGVTSVFAAYTANGTISGGEGVDLISVRLAAATAGVSVNSTAAIVAVISDVSKDTVRTLSGLNFTAGGGNTAANWVGLAPTMVATTGVGTFIGTGAGGLAPFTAGSIGVFSDGTDSIIAIKQGDATSSAVSMILVKGVDLTITTATGSVTATATTFRFSVAANTGGGMNITFS